MEILLPTQISETIGRFSGRAWLLPRILDWFDGQSAPLLLLVGKPGTGKSMVTAWLAGFGPEPQEPGDQALLRRVRDLVAGAHFCQVSSDQNAPLTMAGQLARQLTENVAGFAKGIRASLGSRVVINASANVGSVRAGGNFTNVLIERLDLGKHLGPGGVEQALINPLRWLYDHGFREEILLLVDSLDEAFLYKSDYRITDAVLELAKLDLPVRILATARDETDVLAPFRAYPKIDLIVDAPAGADDVGEYIDRRLAGVTGIGMGELGQRIQANAGGNFLFAHLVVEDLLRRQSKRETLVVNDVPETLSQFYHAYMQRLGQPSQWEKRYSKVLGLAAVAQDRGLERSLMARILDSTPEHTLRTVKAVKPFLEGSLDNGPFRSFHKSFTEFLLEDESNSDYRIPASAPHARIVYHYWPRKQAAPPTKDWDSYARRHIATHLAGAGRSADEAERHRMAQRLVEMVSDPALQDLSQVDLSNLAETARRLEDAVRTACRDDLTDGLPLVMRSVRAWQAFYNAVLKPAHIFDHAALGQTETALEKLVLFPAELRWKKAAGLGIAWLAAKSNPARAAAVLEGVSQVPPFPSPLEVLSSRVNQALGGPAPGLRPLPEPPSQPVVQEILASILGDKVDLGMIQSYRSGVHISIDEGLSEELNAQGDAGPSYQALEHAPILVSFAANNPHQEDEFFRLYLNIQAANQYIYYRNVALWILMEAVLRHPGPDWAVQALRQVLELALAGERFPFEENTPLALLGLRAASGGASAVPARAALDQRKQEAMQKAGELNEVRRRSDVYGEHKRRLCALALAYRADPSAATQLQELLDLALRIPRGFAGYMVQAWLTLYETLAICSWQRPADLDHCLEEAIISAHKIQDPNYCVLSTARMRTMSEGWLAMVPDRKDIRAVVERFAEKPLAPAFAPLYQVNDHYIHRYEGDGERIALPPTLVEADTLWKISDLLGLSLEGLLELNEELGKDTKIPFGAVVRLHDPDFVPMAAQRLSAEVLTAQLEPREKRRLLQQLIPHALPSRTATDTILARLLFASGAEDFDALDVRLPDAGQPAAGGGAAPVGFEGLT